MPCLRWIREDLQLIADIAQEARDEGPQAVGELEQFREEFSLASQLIESRREGKPRPRHRTRRWLKMGGSVA